MRYQILLISLIISNILFSQENDLLYNDYLDIELYQSKCIKKCITLNSDYKDGELTSTYVSLIEYFDRNGLLVREREFYDSDTTDGWVVYYNYDSLQRLSYFEWNWLDSKDWEMTTYEYNDFNLPLKSCDYYKRDSKSNYHLDSCEYYLYKNGRIVLRYSDSMDTLSFYIHKRNKSLRYSRTKELISAYKNGEMISWRNSNENYYYTRDKSNNIIKTIRTDNEGNDIGETIFEYRDNLLQKTTSYDENGMIKYIETYSYKLWECNSN